MYTYIIMFCDNRFWHSIKNSCPKGLIIVSSHNRSTPWGAWLRSLACSDLRLRQDMSSRPRNHRFYNQKNEPQLFHNERDLSVWTMKRWTDRKITNMWLTELCALMFFLIDLHMQTFISLSDYPLRKLHVFHMELIAFACAKFSSFKKRWIALY